MAESITLQTSDSNIQQSDVLGRLSFAASNESSGSDARLIGASIYAIAENDFTEISNATSLIFATAASENAQESMRINSNGYIGINTTSPLYELHVNGTVYGSSIIENGHPVIISDTTAASGSDTIENIISLTQAEFNLITPASGTVYIITDQVSSVQLSGSGISNYISKWSDTYTLTNSLIYDNGTNVGIGTNNPSAKFNVENGNIIFNDLGGNYDVRIEGDSDENLLFIDASNNTVNIGTGTSTGNKLLLNSSNSRSYSDILASGAIGTDSSIIRIANTYNTTTESFAGFAMSATRSGSNVSQIAFIASVSTNASTYQPHIVFASRNGASTYIELMRINHLGDVGIGTSSPTAKLNVEGGNIIFNDNGDNYDFRVEGDSDTNLLFLDASTDMIGIGTSTPSTKLDINSDKIRLRTAKTPSSASDSGNIGDICWDSNYLYICIASNSWKRSPISSWP